MRIVFMGSPQFAVPSLEALHSSTHEVVAVVTQPDRPSGRKLQTQPPPIKVVAQRLNIPLLQPSTTKSPEFLGQLRAFDPEMLVVVAYGEILRSNVLGLPHRGAVNLHASLLPKYRGAAPIAWAILQGETITGATTMFMNEAMDAGPILLQEEIEISATDTTGTLSKKISEQGALLLRHTIDSLQDDAITPKPQDVQLVCYAPKLKKEDGRMNWIHPAGRLSRQVRAFDPWPGSFSRIRGVNVKFWLAQPSQDTTDQHPGMIIGVDRHSIDVACGEGSVLKILEVQPENRPRMPVADFIHGHPIHVGNRFDS